jgi:hypothetical protein
MRVPSAGGLALALALVLGSTPGAGAAAQPVQAGATPAALAASGAAAATPAPAMAGPAHCRFAVPAGWTARDLRWSGGCDARLAQGRGLLRAYEGGRVVRAFYGRLQAGWPVLGVVEQPDGFEAGRFEAGRVVVDGERNAVILAFDEASAAARQVAAVYRQGGNLASARFYERKARQLAQQMD